MNPQTTELTIVIPVYRSADCLPELLRQLTEQLAAMGRSYEVILVDDASPDDSWAVLKSTAPRYAHVKAVSLMRNSGQAFATICGMSHAQGQIVVTMDDDLQQPPDQLPKLLDALESDPDCDCVFGHFEEKKHAFYRNVGSRAIRWINRRSFGLPSHIRSSSFRAMRRPAVDAILRHQTRNPALAALIYGSTRRVKSIPVDHAARHAGTSNYTLAKQFRLAFDHICNVSMLPLHMISAMGFCFCGLSLLLVVSFLYRYLSGSVGVAGWTTVVILVSFFSGVILLSLGIIGEYLVRVLREVRGTPAYVEREQIEFSDTSQTDCSAEATDAQSRPQEAHQIRE